MTDTGDAGGVVEEVVGLLETFQLTEYEARCFAALSRIGRGTAKDVSEVSGVPRARVYDCMESLAEQGLADVQNTSPRRFRAASPDEAVNALERRYTRRIERLGDLLSRLEPPASSDDRGDVWVTEGDDEVVERLRELVEDADETILLAVAEEGLLSEAFLDELRAASARGVGIRIGSPGDPIRERLREAVPGADVVETWTWWETHPVQPGAITSVLMADDRALLVSVDVEDSLPGVRKHRAVWTDSEAAPLVGLMRPLIEEAIFGPDR